MRVGVTLYFQGYQDWDRFEARERGEGEPIDPTLDQQRWSSELEGALEVEELGFDSIWSVEHHISPYTMIPNPIGILQFLAGATKKVDLGTMVVVLPWHRPLRVAEDMVMLQYMMPGRRPYIGVGRGLGRREFAQMNYDMNETSGRFAESIQCIQAAILNETFSFQGEYFQYENVTLRPRPLNAKQLVDDMHFSWGSPSSAPIGASYGLKPLIIPQRAWPEYHAELESFNKGRHEAGFADPVRPRLHMNIFCGETHEKAEEGARKYMKEYTDSARRNYELGGQHFAQTKGYDHYQQMSDALASAGGDVADMMGEMYVQNHVWGTPDECVEKIQGLCDAFHPEEFMFVFRYGSMSKEVADASTRLFAKEALPAVHAIPTEPAIDYMGATA